MKFDEAVDLKPEEKPSSKPKFLSPFTRRLGGEKKRRRLKLSPYSDVLVPISSIGIRFKLVGALISILFLSLPAPGEVPFPRQKQILKEETQKRAQILVQQLAAVGKEGLLTKQELNIYSTIKS